MINQISLANTFGHFVTTISSLIGLANTLVDGPSFTANTELKLTKPGVTLNVRTNALVSGNLTVQNTVNANSLVVTGPNTSVTVHNTLFANNLIITNSANISNISILRAEVYSGNLNVSQVTATTGILNNVRVLILVSSGGQHTCNSVQTGWFQSTTGTANLDSMYSVSAVIDELRANLTNSTITISTLNTSTLINCTFSLVAGLHKANVGLDQVDNTSDATKNAATANLSNKTLLSPTIVTGNVSADPTTPFGIASKQYVDNRREDYGAILNGRMDIWQYGNTFSTNTSSTNAFQPFLGKMVADRFDLYQNGGGPELTITKSNNVPSFANSGVVFDSSLFITCNAIDPTPNANSNQRFTIVRTIIEGNVWKNYIGKPGVISFWVYSSVTGTYSFNTAGPSPYDSVLLPQYYTVNSANTWEYKTITIPAQTVSNTSPSWSANSLTGIAFQWGLESGSAYTISDGFSPDVWISGFGARRANTVQPFYTQGAIWAITGVRYDIGTVPKSTSWRPFPDELQLCKRYFQKSFNLDVPPRHGLGASTGEYIFIAGKGGTGIQNTTVNLPAELRGPNEYRTIYVWNPILGNGGLYDITSNTHCTTDGYISPTGKVLTVSGRGNTSTSVGNVLGFHWTARADSFNI